MVANWKPYIRSIGSECKILTLPPPQKTPISSLPPTSPLPEEIDLDEMDDIQSDHDSLYTPGSSEQSSDIDEDEIQRYLSIFLVLQTMIEFNQYTFK